MGHNDYWDGEGDYMTPEERMEEELSAQYEKMFFLGVERGTICDLCCMEKKPTEECPTCKELEALPTKNF